MVCLQVPFCQGCKSTVIYSAERSVEGKYEMHIPHESSTQIPLMKPIRKATKAGSLSPLCSRYVA